MACHELKSASVLKLDIQEITASLIPLGQSVQKLKGKSTVTTVASKFKPRHATAQTKAMSPLLVQSELWCCFWLMVDTLETALAWRALDSLQSNPGSKPEKHWNKDTRSQNREGKKVWRWWNFSANFPTVATISLWWCYLYRRDVCGGESADWHRLVPRCTKWETTPQCAVYQQSLRHFCKRCHAQW